MTTSVKVGNRRLLVLAAILDTADAEHRRKGEPTYNQCVWSHYDGISPACAAAHWEASPQGKRVSASEGGFMDHFALEIKIPGLVPLGGHGSLESELFSGTGCGNARTAKQAAKYIRGFVRRREKALAKAAT
jgi:hypothetical protein